MKHLSSTTYSLTVIDKEIKKSGRYFKYIINCKFNNDDLSLLHLPKLKKYLKIEVDEESFFEFNSDDVIYYTLDRFGIGCFTLKIHKSISDEKIELKLDGYRKGILYKVDGYPANLVHISSKSSVKNIFKRKDYMDFYLSISINDNEEPIKRILPIFNKLVSGDLLKKIQIDIGEYKPVFVSVLNKYLFGFIKLSTDIIKINPHNIIKEEENVE